MAQKPEHEGISNHTTRRHLLLRFRAGLGVLQQDPRARRILVGFLLIDLLLFAFRKLLFGFDSMGDFAGPVDGLLRLTFFALTMLGILGYHSLPGHPKRQSRLSRSHAEDRPGQPCRRSPPSCLQGAGQAQPPPDDLDLRPVRHPAWRVGGASGEYRGWSKRHHCKNGLGLWPGIDPGLCGPCYERLAQQAAMEQRLPLPYQLRPGPGARSGRTGHRRPDQNPSCTARRLYRVGQECPAQAPADAGFTQRSLCLYF